MRFDKIIPTSKLAPYIKYFVISENFEEQPYKVLPGTNLVIGFQYRGSLAEIKGNKSNNLVASGITGLSDSFKTFKNSFDTGTILIYFNEIGISHFTKCPANELFNLSVSLDELFDKIKIAEVEEKLVFAKNDKQRITIIEQFLLSQLREVQNDKMVIEAVNLIYQAKGTIKIKELSNKLLISQSPLEKRFRKMIGTSPKKFASIIRFNSVLSQIKTGKPLTDICFENNFFDQAHFIKDFKQYTGDTPENYKRFL